MNESERTGTTGNGGKEFGAGITKKRVLTAVMLVVMAWGAWYYTRMTAGFSGDTAVWIRIPHNATPEQVKDSIVAALGDGFGHRVASLWNGDIALSHGAYRIEPGEKAWRVARRIGQGNRIR